MQEEAQPMTVDEIAQSIGYKMMTIIALMHNMGLTTFPHFVKTYVQPTREKDELMRDFTSWLQWAASSKSADAKHDMLPKELVEICCRLHAEAMNEVMPRPPFLRLVKTEVDA